MKSLLLTTLTIFLSSYTFAESQLVELISNKKTWSKLNWDKFESSVVFLNSAWKKSEENELRVKVMEDVIKGVPLEFVIVNRDSAYNLNISNKISLNQCKTILSYFEKSFGKKSNSLDLSNEVPLVSNDKNPMIFTNLKHQWTVGNSHITYSCSGFRAKNNKDDDSHYFSINFSQKSEISTLKPLFVLQCTQTIKNHVTNKTEKASDNYFVVDEYNSKLRYRNYTALSGDHEFTENLIHVRYEPSAEDKARAQHTKDTLTSDYRIDRTTGDYLVKVFDEDSVLLLEVTGKCKKSKLPKKIF